MQLVHTEVVTDQRLRIPGRRRDRAHSRHHIRRIRVV